MSRRVWSATLWAVVAFLAALALAWLAMPIVGALASPRPQEAPRRLADVLCGDTTSGVRAGRNGLEVAIVDANGCIIGWIPWEPMVRSR